MRVVVKVLLLAATATALGAALPAAAGTQVLVVGGLGGEPQFEERFVEWAGKIATASASAAGGADAVTQLTGAAAKREAIEAALRRAAQNLSAGDQFILVLVGHGNHDGTEYRFNIPGPDITGSQILALLDRIPQAVPQLVVNTTSASGAIVDAWARPYRAVITATRSGGERNATRFGAFWAEGLGSEEADRDRDGVLTAKEAYEYANRRVGDAFKADAAIATEHARTGGADPARFVVARFGAVSQFANDRELIALRAQQGEIEGRLETVRAQKSSLSEDQYYAQLEPVLVDLARLGARIDARLAALGAEGGGGASR